jgi:hypothetical protein
MTPASRLFPWAAALGAGLLAAGCGATKGMMHRLHEPPMELASGDERGVKVRTPFNMDNPQWIADAHCKKFGKRARLVETAKTYAFFDCVEPGG